MKVQNKLIIQHRGSTSFFKGSVPISDFETDNSDVRQWSVDGAQLKSYFICHSKR